MTKGELRAKILGPNPDEHIYDMSHADFQIKRLTLATSGTVEDYIVNITFLSQIFNIRPVFDIDYKIAIENYSLIEIKDLYWEFITDLNNRKPDCTEGYGDNDEEIDIEQLLTNCRKNSRLATNFENLQELLSNCKNIDNQDITEEEERIKEALEKIIFIASNYMQDLESIKKNTSTRKKTPLEQFKKDLENGTF